MRRFLQAFWNDTTGASAVEFAIVAPVMMVLLLGSFHVSMLLYADSMTRGAIGEGARFARLYRTPASPTAWAGPTATEICTHIVSVARDLGNGTITGLRLTRSTNGTANALTVAMDYQVDMNFAFFTLSPEFTRTRQVYVIRQPDFGATAHACTV